MNLTPGEYFRLVSEVTHTSRFQNGTIGPDGSITSAGIWHRAATSILYWHPGTEGVKTATLERQQQNNPDQPVRCCLHAQEHHNHQPGLQSRDVVYADNGLVEVSGSYAPLTDSGSLLVLDWKDDDFVIETG